MPALQQVGIRSGGEARWRPEMAPVVSPMRYTFVFCCSLHDFIFSTIKPPLRFDSNKYSYKHAILGIYLYIKFTILFEIKFSIN